MNKLATFLLLNIFCLSVGRPGDAPAEKTKTSPLSDAREEIYKKIGAVELSLYIFEPADHKPSDKRPAALFFFGGGWSGGTPAQFAAHCRYLASRGMIGIVADYRVKSRQKTTPFECVKDGKSAVRWIRANAERLGIDTAKLAVGGGSAGGHVAAATATIKGINEDGESTIHSATPNALLLFNPVYDNGPGGYGHKQFGDRFKEISPMHNIKTGMPPAIVFLGTNDALIPVETAKSFQQKMKAVGSRSDLHLYEGQTHGFFNHKEFKGDASPRNYYETMLATDRFLTSLGFLSGDATLIEPSFAFVETEGKSLDILYDQRPVARYMFAFDASTKEQRHETYKPYLHVFGKKGDRLITKGAGGKFTHHRGIFLGFSKTKVGDKTYDLWHMKQGVQVHKSFENQVATSKQATFTSNISWETNEGVQLASEKRTIVISPGVGSAYAMVDMQSELTAVADDIVFGGDPEHAGAQFRPADDIVKEETAYVFHEESVDPKQTPDLPWAGETFRFATGKQRYSVVILNHSENPKGTRFSAYRDYGRFGAFPEFSVSKGETATLRYRWLIAGGKKPAAEVIESAAWRER